MKRALVVYHVPYERLAGFAGPIEQAGYAIERLDVGDAGFGEADFLAPDLLVLLGGPMALYERAEYPWIEGELARLTERLARKRPTLGICLGAQMIAAALGAQVYRGPAREVGFAPVALTPKGRESPLAVIEDVPVLHWHGDGFDLPEGATLLARTALYPQAFAIGRWLLALQYHPEMGGAGDGIESWTARAENYLAGAGTSGMAILADHAAFGPAASAAGKTLLSAWLDRLPRRSR
ncbi:MAG TPA: glutamine amidotransferase [Sphingomonas sp.]|nr:glutamine amidotransferase [Sphingomonas sp.]